MDTGPSFAAAIQILDRLRGFDLGDDAQQLEECERLAVIDDLTDAGWQLLGVLRYRAAAWGGAAEAFERAGRSEELATKGRFLAACARLRGGDAEGALAALDALADEAPEDDDISMREVQIARGDALWALGRAGEAEEAYADALEREASAELWLDLARLRAGEGRREAALEAIDRALEVDSSLHAALYARAALRAEAGDAAGALSALDEAIGWDRAYAARAREDTRFAGMRGDPELARRIAPPAPKDLGWLDRFAKLAALRDDAALAAAGVSWCAEEEAREGGEALAERYAGNWQLGALGNDAIWDACGELSRGKLLVARCPAVQNRNGSEARGELYVDPARPEEILFAPSSEVPPVLWIPVAAEAGALRDALAELYPSRRVPRLELPRVSRAFMGYLRELGVPSPYSGQMEQAGPHELDRHFAFSPYVDALVWGTAAADDPWPERIPPQPGYQIKLVGMSRRVRAQREGGICGFTRRTLFSRSQITIELHQRALYVWEIRYRPSRHACVIERFNERFGLRFPTDLPLDVVGVLVGFELAEAEWLEARLGEQTDAGAVAAYLRVIAAVRHSDLGVLRLLRRHLDHESPVVRGTIANLCMEYGWESLLEDVGMKEQDAELRALIDRVLDVGIAAPQFDDMGEPVGLYSEDEDEEGGEGAEGDGEDEDDEDDDDEEGEDDDDEDDEEYGDDGEGDEDEDEDDDEDEEA
ncbi:MAG: hypothetical protein IT372_15825 [Polyangiaceae bacterium]|nr:hypothetical protein [Polyangiaceae bacterium]